MSSERSETKRSDNHPPTIEGGELDVLGNECSRTILVASRDRPRTARELTELTDSSSATVYRRLNDLMQADLIEECVRFDEDGSHTTAYRSVVGRISVSIAPSGMEVSTSQPPEHSGESRSGSASAPPDQ